MAKRQSTKKSAKKSNEVIQRPVAEDKFAEELEILCAADDGPRPPGWKMTPGRVIDFLCGTDGEKVKAGKKSQAISRKFCLLYTSPSPRDQRGSRMPSSA